jgi:gamma-glutamyltranspeptidase/glutathione hydrolase
MDDFSIQPGVANVFGLVGGAANEIRPLKRPLSSMTPTIVLDEKGAARMVIGAPGGSRIITSVYKVIVNHLRDGLDPVKAMEQCRFHHQWSPDVVLMESGCGQLKSGLESLYPVEIKDSVFGEVQLVGRGADGKMFAVADPRGHGQGRVFVFSR